MTQHATLPPELLTRGVTDIIVRKHLEEQLASGKKLRIKLGVDPTNTFLHIGHAVPLWKLRMFQDLGHTIVFLIGDFTARFGDPSDRLEKRDLGDTKDIEAATAAYIDQCKKILDFQKTEIRRNSEWYDTMSAEALLRLASNFSVAQMLERDMFAERRRTGAEIGLHEPLYPVLQGYDSVMLKSDLTVVGSDQLFNEMAARPLQERAGQTPQDIMTMSVLIGTDGKQKMSKTFANNIPITASAQDQFGGVMRIPDTLISHYFELATLLPDTELGILNTALQNGELAPRDAKLRLAREIVTLYHSVSAATQAEAEFIRVFSERELPTEIREQTVDLEEHRLDDLLVLVGFASSRSEAQRLVGSGAVRIDEAVMGDWHAPIAVHDGMVVAAGKRNHVRIRFGAK